MQDLNKRAERKHDNKNNREGARPSFKAQGTPPNSLRCNIISHGLDAMRKVSLGNLDLIHEKSVTSA